MADLIGASPKEIVFTSGATESNNLALRGVAEFYGKRRNHLITTVTEHKCVLDSCRRLAEMRSDGGEKLFDITYLGVKPNGLVDLDTVRVCGSDCLVFSILTPQQKASKCNH